MGEKNKSYKHKIVILTGQSSSGKSTIEEKLARNKFHRIITYTTRPPRDNEKDGIDYNFVSYDTFMDMVTNGHIIEHRTYNTVYGNWYYGSSDLNIDLSKHDYVIVLTFDGVEAFVNHFGAENCIIFYIDCPKHIREARAKERPNFNEKEWQRRLITDKQDFSLDRIIKYANFKIANYDKPLYDVIEEILKDIKIWKS